MAAEEALPEEQGISVTTPDGTTMPATLTGRDASTDVALLRVEGLTQEALALTDAVPQAGALALAVGDAATSALGIVSVSGGAWHSMRGGEISARIELGVSLRPEAEGGAALDMDGRGFGMAVRGTRRRLLVIPTVTLERVANILERDGHIPGGYLGLSLQLVQLDGEDGRGLIVTRVDGDGPGAEAGMRQGDVITAWNGSEVTRWRELRRALAPGTVGETLTLSLRRDGGARDVLVREGHAGEHVVLVPAAIDPLDRSLHASPPSTMMASFGTFGRI